MRHDIKTDTLITLYVITHRCADKRLFASTFEKQNSFLTL